MDEEIYVVETIDTPEVPEIPVDVAEVEVQETQPVNEEVHVSKNNDCTIGKAKTLAIGLAGATAGGVATHYAVKLIDKVVSFVAEKAKEHISASKEKRLEKKEAKLLKQEEALDRAKTKIEIDKKIENSKK